MSNADHMSAYEYALRECPVVAILRGVKPDEVVEVGEALYAAGIRIAEIPLNSPEPFESIKQLATAFNGRMVVGAGTVLTVADAERVAAAGGQIAVSPNCDANVIKASTALGMVALPGVSSASEAFAALAAGAQDLKIFPATSVSPKTIKAWRAVLPKETRLIAVGGVTPDNLADYVAAGCAGIGAGSDIYAPGRSAEEVGQRAAALNDAFAASNARPRVEIVADSQCTIGETPVIDSVSGDILWTDLVEGVLHRYALSSGDHKPLTLSQPVTSLAIASDGALLASTANGAAVIDPISGEVTPYASVRHPYDDVRLNDSVIDSKDRLWAGSMSMGLLSGQGALHVIERNGASHLVKTGFGVCNGMAFSADGETLYMVDTLTRALLKMELGGGDIPFVKSVRVVTDFANLPGKPDGLTMAPDGTQWVAMWNGACVAQIDNAGRLLQRVDLPAIQPSACVFDGGGALYVTASNMRLSNHDIEKHSGSGALLKVTGV